jgi:ADP-ribose pyrophosphatase YjhB (NUDIX family)
MLDYIGNLRKLVGHTKILIPGVRALIFDERQRLLLERQIDFDSWSLPHGCVDLNESALAAVKREVKEETGISIHRADLFGIYTQPKYSVTYPNGDEVQTFTIAFLVTEWSGNPVADQEEVSEVGFFPLDGLPEPLYHIHIETIEDYKGYNGMVIVK